MLITANHPISSTSWGQHNAPHQRWFPFCWLHPAPTAITHTAAPSPLRASSIMIFNINLAVLKTEAIPIAKTRFFLFFFSNSTAKICLPRDYTGKYSGFSITTWLLWRSLIKPVCFHVSFCSVWFIPCSQMENSCLNTQKGRWDGHPTSSVEGKSCVFSNPDTQIHW